MTQQNKFVLNTFLRSCIIIIIIIFLCKMSHPCSKGYFFVQVSGYLLYVYMKTTFPRQTRICYYDIYIFRIIIIKNYVIQNVLLLEVLRYKTQLGLNSTAMPLQEHPRINISFSQQCQLLGLKLMIKTVLHYSAATSCFKYHKKRNSL